MLDNGLAVVPCKLIAPPQHSPVKLDGSAPQLIWPKLRKTRWPTCGAWCCPLEQPRLPPPTCGQTSMTCSRGTPN